MADTNNIFGRREFLRDASITASLAMLAPGTLVSFKTEAATVNTATDVMDEALERLDGLALLTNHGPMAAEALLAIGCADRVVPFVEAYRSRFTNPFPARVERIEPNNWRAALGKWERGADWFDFFDVQIKEQGWRNVIAQWGGNLAEGLCAAAAHGLIRTAHAVRSLNGKETDLRKEELANGLAYWAAYHQILPNLPSVETEKKLKPAEAIVRVPVLPSDKRRRGSIMIALSSLSDFSPFARVVNLADTSGDPSQVLSALTETFADVYVKNVADHNFIALIHSITGSTAIRTLLPHVSAETGQKLLRYGWQLGAALYSISGTDRLNKDNSADIKRTNLIDRAVTTLEEHAIKFTEACLREYSLNPNPVYLKAAADAVSRLG